MKPHEIHRAMQFALCVALYVIAEPLLRNPEFLLTLYGAGAIRITPFIIETIRGVQKSYREAGLLSPMHAVEAYLMHTIFWPITVWLEAQSPGTLAATILEISDDVVARRHRCAVQTVALAQRDIAQIEYFKANRR